MLSQVGPECLTDRRILVIVTMGEARNKQGEFFPVQCVASYDKPTLVVDQSGKGRFCRKAANAGSYSSKQVYATTKVHQFEPDFKTPLSTLVAAYEETVDLVAEKVPATT